MSATKFDGATPIFRVNDLKATVDWAKKSDGGWTKEARR
jgi:hypothetical protein